MLISKLGLTGTRIRGFLATMAQNKHRANTSVSPTAVPNIITHTMSWINV